MPINAYKKTKEAKYLEIFVSLKNREGIEKSKHL